MAQIDWNEFNEYFQNFDKETIKIVTDIFIEEYDMRMNTLQKNIKEKDFEKVDFNAHGLKSVVVNYFAPNVVKLLQALENMGKEKNEEHMFETFEKLKPASKELYEELVEYLKISQIR
jgi:HPt (histidine-containing phosphotransfer) domain-containing protein